MRHRHHIVKTAFVLLAALVGGLFNELCEAASTNTVDQTLTDTNLAAKVATDYEKYKKGQIDKGTMAKSLWDAENQTTQNLYGKVVDQNGQPVAGVDVTGIVIRIDEKNIRYKTQTDTSGLFQFTGLHGSDMGADVVKEGYEMDYQRGTIEPSGQSSPANRVIYTMWKLRGPEPMKHMKLHAYIPCDGTITRFDLLTGKKNPDGDLLVSLTRSPINIKRGKPFDWTLTLQMTNGGVQVITNIYSNEAPENGYQTNFTFKYDSSSSNWTSEIEPALYFTSRTGQVYGRMALNVMTDFQPPPTLFDADIYANPNGSRNLEFDPQKQIR